MLLGKVKGTVVASQKEPSMVGFKFLVVTPLDEKAAEVGGSVVAVDAVGAGVGEGVLYATGSAARQTVATKDRPCDAVVMAIVDILEVGGREVYRKGRE